MKRPRIDLLQAAADIVSALPDAVVVTGLDRRVLAVNRAAADLFGWPSAELVGQPIAAQVHMGERAHVA
ncbi:MAG TPA: PAS domain-containing protein, partial [Gemmatimonadales bacterium]|nr:PAS domain-containing protein [Gemmatimonadales bacterium]